MTRYYKLKDLENIVELKPRMLKYKMKSIKEKYKNSKLLYKEGRQWFIHESIVFEFDRERKGLNQHNFKSFCSVSFEGNVSGDFIREIMNISFLEMKQTKKTTIYYVIEKNRSNQNHLHFLCNWNKTKKDEGVIYRTIKDYSIINFDMRPITNFRNLNNYLNKDFQYKKLLQ